MNHNLVASNFDVLIGPSIFDPADQLYTQSATHRLSFSLYKAPMCVRILIYHHSKLIHTTQNFIHQEMVDAIFWSALQFTRLTS